MKASELINADLDAETKKIFTVEKAPATLFARGLAGVEAVAIEVLASNSDPDSAADAEWQAVIQGSNALVLDANNTLLTLSSPGNYRFVAPATAGVVVIGMYGSQV